MPSTDRVTSAEEYPMTSPHEAAGGKEAQKAQKEEEPGTTSRHAWAMIIDFLFAAVAGTVVTLVLTPKFYASGEAHSLAVDTGIAAASYLGCSFVNQVLLARALHGSLGRRVLDLHAIMEATGRPVGLPRLALRWLVGLPMVPFGLLACLFPGAEAYPLELFGITVVRTDETGPR
ncbi:RDD family protein [Streptomyces sp. NRRL F-5630]|uniref:RDD family protein n=1 Tax=Streptomyces sp. NRRL F-5630 TaxID=1463864 RepID=UPI003EB8D66E